MLVILRKLGYNNYSCIWYYFRGSELKIFKLQLDLTLILLKHFTSVTPTTEPIITNKLCLLCTVQSESRAHFGVYSDSHSAHINTKAGSILEKNIF